MLDQLRVFRLVAEMASFTQAASAAGLTRPAVSQQVNQLERHFGVQLFNRTTRQVALTSAGELLLAHVRRVFAEVSAMESALATFSQRVALTLDIGASTLPGEFLVPVALVAVRAAHPGVETRVRVGDSDAVIDWVRSGQVDVGLIGRQAESPDLVVKPLAVDEIVLVFPPDQPAPGQLTPADLCEIPILLREPGSGTRTTVMDALVHYGIRVQDLRVAAELGSPEAIKAGVRSGMGAAFLALTSLTPGEFQVVRVEGLDLHRPVCACWRPDRPPGVLAQMLLNELTRVAAR